MGRQPRDIHQLADVPRPFLIVALLLLMSRGSATIDVSTLTCAGTDAWFSCGTKGLAALCITPAPPNNRGKCGSCNAGASVGGVCSSTAALDSTNGSAVTTLCGTRGTLLSCPDGSIVISSCGANNAPCRNTTVCPLAQGNTLFGIQCAPAQNLTIQTATCEWRLMNADGSVGCEANEVMVALCNGPNQGDCGGSPYGGAAKCCRNMSSTSCAPRPGFRFIASSDVCPIGTAVNGFCSVRCDPQGYFGFRSNPGMFACTGWAPSQSLSAVTSSGCSLRVTCAAGQMITAIGQCYVAGTGPGTTITCATPSYASVSSSDCQWLYGNDNVWCPEGYVATAACGPNLQNACPSGYDTELYCCRYSSYHNLGSPCPTNFAFGISALSSAGSPAPYGADLVTPLPFVSLGNVAGAHYCSNTLYVTNNVKSVVYYIPLTTKRANISMGTFGSTGFTKSPWNPDLWNDRGTLLNTPTEVLSEASTYADASGCKIPMFVDYGNHMLRKIVIGSMTSAAFEADVVVGAQSTIAKTLTNGTSVYTSTLPNVYGAAYRSADDTLLLTVDGAILLVMNPSTVFSSGGVYYWQGNGAPGATTTNAFRTTTSIWYPKQIVIVNQVTTFAADYDGTSSGGLLVMTDMSTGLTGTVTGLYPTLVPYGVAYFTGATGRPNLFLSDRTNHALWRYDLATNNCWLVSATPGTAGFTDRVAVSSLMMSSPGRLTASGNQLFIVDEGNQRVIQYNVEAVCDTGYDSISGCLACAVGYYGYPRCRKACSAEADCHSHAVFATGDPSTKCQCSCAGNFAGSSCSYCRSGYDPRTNCTSCAYGYGQVNCKTLTSTMSLSARVTLTDVITITKTITPPPTPTGSTDPTNEPSASFTRSKTGSASIESTVSVTASMTLSRPKSRTPLPTRTATRTKTRAISRSHTLELTDEQTATRTRTLLSTPSTTFPATGSATATLTLIPSPSSTPTRTLIVTDTVTRPMTFTATSSYALIPPQLVLQSPLFLSKFDMIDPVDITRRTITIGITGGTFDVVANNSTRNCGLYLGTNSPITTSVDTSRTSCTTMVCRVQLVMDANAKVVVDGHLTLSIASKCIHGQSTPAPLVIPVLVSPHDPFVPLAASAAVLLGGTAVSIGVGWLAATPALMLAHSQAAFYTSACSWGARSLFGVSFDMSPTQLDFLTDLATTALLIYSLLLILSAVVVLIAAHYTAETKAQPFVLTLSRWRVLGRLTSFVYIPFVVPSVIMLAKAARTSLPTIAAVAFGVLWAAPAIAVVLCVTLRFDWTWNKVSLLKLPATCLGRFASRTGSWSARMGDRSRVWHVANYVEGCSSPATHAVEIFMLFVSAGCAGAVLSEQAPNCGAIVSVAIGVHFVRFVVATLIPVGIPCMTLGGQLHGLFLTAAHVLSLLWALEVAGDWAQTTAEYTALGSMCFAITWIAWLGRPYAAYRRAQAEDAFSVGMLDFKAHRNYLDKLSSTDEDASSSSSAEEDESEAELTSSFAGGPSNPLLLRVPERGGGESAWHRWIGSSSSDDEGEGRRRPSSPRRTQQPPRPTRRPRRFVSSDDDDML